MLPFCFCSCFPCSHFRLDLITHSCVLLTFWSVTLITDLRSVYVTHLFVICRLLATSPLCLSSASRLLYISDVKYKYSARWGDCPSVRISSWILPANSPLFSSVSSAFWQLWPSSDLRHSVLKSSEIRGCRYRKGTAHMLKPSPQKPPHLLRLSSTTLHTYLHPYQSSLEELVLTTIFVIFSSTSSLSSPQCGLASDVIHSRCDVGADNDLASFVLSSSASLLMASTASPQCIHFWCHLQSLCAEPRWKLDRICWDMSCFKM